MPQIVCLSPSSSVRVTIYMQSGAFFTFIPRCVIYYLKNLKNSSAWKKLRRTAAPILTPIIQNVLSHFPSDFVMPALLCMMCYLHWRTSDVLVSNVSSVNLPCLTSCCPGSKGSRDLKSNVQRHRVNINITFTRWNSGGFADKIATSLMTVATSIDYTVVRLQFSVSKGTSNFQP